MKTRIIKHIAMICFAALAWNCAGDNSESGSFVSQEGSIVLDFSAANNATRATVADTNIEAKVDFLDVLIFDTDGNKVHYERVSSTTEGKAVLSARRSSFAANAQYWVYLLANSNLETASFSGVATLADLKGLQQEDSRLHLTGLAIDGAPQHFLMDGIAYIGAIEPATAAAVVLFDGDTAKNTQLNATMRRAAAKIFVTLNKGEKVTFDSANAPSYYLHNMPYSTPLVADVVPQAKLRNTPRTSGGYLSSSANSVTLVAYAYNHDFTSGSFLTNRTNVIVNIPLTYEGTTYANNFYQVPISKNNIIERNTYYAVTATINAPGAEDIYTPVEIEDVTYQTEDWSEVVVNVGGETDKPKFLHVNLDQMEMRYVATDNSTLVFSSSSDVTITVKEAYYYNKMGVRTNVTAEELAAISGSTEVGELSGNVTIDSPIPTNKTIRYFVLSITNEDGFTREVTVAQYPLEYITNIQSFYSYRSDFFDEGTEVTTYKVQGSGETAISYDGVSGGVIQYEYHKGTTSSGFFRSKVALQTYDSGEYEGYSNVAYYRYADRYEWQWTGSRYERVYVGTELDTSSTESTSNARMYHIRITSTSDKYRLGLPKLNSEGFTDPSGENSVVVSPSFMIASRLGFINSDSGGLDYLDKTSETFLNLVRNHCLNYVEVYVDENGVEQHLDDWRLPTRAELQIIMDFQADKNTTQADAIDYLLNARYYMCAEGRLENTKNGVANNQTTGTAMRCIRDVKN